jgi:hypothetical protein
MLELFSLVGFFTVFLFLLFLGASLLAINSERHSVVSVFTILFFVGILVFSDILAKVSFSVVVLAFICYFGVGILWSFKQWITFLYKEKEFVKQIFENQNAIGDWSEYVKGKLPLASENKAKIVYWITAWPMSMSWWILDWPRKISIMLYNKLSSYYDAVTQRVFKEK